MALFISDPICVCIEDDFICPVIPLLRKIAVNLSRTEFSLTNEGPAPCYVTESLAMMFDEAVETYCMRMRLRDEKLAQKLEQMRAAKVRLACKERS